MRTTTDNKPNDDCRLAATLAHGTIYNRSVNSALTPLREVSSTGLWMPPARDRADETCRQGVGMQLAKADFTS